MITHPYFNLRLHDDAELQTILGSPVVFRQTLHEWPLSCVQEIRLADGRCLIYKTQWGPSVEGRFYRKVRSPLLVPAQTIYHLGQYQALVLPFIETPKLGGLKLPTDEYLHISRGVCNQIKEIDRRAPVYLNLSSSAKWDAFASRGVASLSRLADHGEFSAVTSASIDLIACAVRSPGVLTVFKRPAVLCHGDLKGDNLFVLADGGVKVIDWQRPYLGPSGLDWVSLLDSRGLDLPGSLEHGLVALYWLLRIAWFSAAAVRWFTPGVKTYDRAIADLTSQIAGLSLN